MNRKFVFKLCFYSLFVLYLLGDLHLWHGYFARKIDKYLRYTPQAQAGDQSAIIAYVYGAPITRNQIERRKSELAFLRGVVSDSRGNIPANRSEHLEALARLDLMQSALLRTRARYSDMSLPDTSDQAGRQISLIASRFGSGDQSFPLRLLEQKSDIEQYSRMIAARLKQLAYLGNVLDNSVPVSEEDLSIYYNEIRERLVVPERRNLKHIFLATLDKQPGDVKTAAEEIMTRLERGADFGELARQHSEDQATAATGGDLGTVTRARSNLLRGIDLFGLPADRPILQQSELGWHIFIAGPVLPPREIGYEEIKPRLVSALYSMRRARGVALYHQQSLRDARREQRVIEPGKRT